jgi:carboxypeptidase T
MKINSSFLKAFLISACFIVFSFYSRIESKDKINTFIFSPEQTERLKELGPKAEPLLANPKLNNLNPLIDPQYHTYEEMMDELDSLAHRFPAIARLESLGVSTQEKRIIWGFKISDNVETDEDEPRVLYVGVHHACEVIGLEICMRLINDLLSGYGIDPQITEWVNNTEIWFIPNLNPDGHSAVTNGTSLYWRKNGRDLNHNGALYEYLCKNWWTCSTEGVNLNRNYDFNWASGGSSDPWHYDYRGETPFSESENQAIRDLASKEKFALSISYHSYGEVVIYPWWWDGAYAPDNPTLDDIAYNIASRILKEDGEEYYDYEVNDALSGMSTNWFYGKLGTYDFTIEVLPYPLFIPPGSQIEGVYQKNKPGALYLLQRVFGPSITGNITDSSTSFRLKATVKILEITKYFQGEMENRESDFLFGRYRWLLLPGDYTLEISKTGYYSDTIHIIVDSDLPTIKDVALVKFYIGDVDLDRKIGLADVIFIANYILKSGPTPAPIYLADVDCDTKMTLADAIYLANYILKGGSSPCSYP